MRTSIHLCSTVVAIVTLLLHAHAAPDDCNGCLRSAYWQVQPDDFLKTGPPSFPEADLVKGRHADLGIAFSGGGTRSASATIGELRGLRKNGWLDQVRYVAAVSGGSWAAIPFVYWRDSLDDLLGESQDPEKIDYARLLAVPNGTLARIVSESSIAAPSFREVAGFYRAANFEPKFDSGIESALGLFGQARREAGRDDKTYTRILEDRFIKKLLGGDGTHRFTWSEKTAGDIEALNHGRMGLATSDFITAASDRPFLIVGGTLVWQRRAFDYPRLVPVEYTPLYAGIRQQFGSRLGGTYISPWAYDSVDVKPDPESTPAAPTVRIRPAADQRLFTLSEVAASSGAAPQLVLLLGGGASGLVKNIFERAAGYFPSYAPVAVVNGTPYMQPPLPHGDGGFSDFFGLMPLLARQVHNILLFINSNDEFDDNRAFRQLFKAVDQRDSSGDGTMNAVFVDEDDHRFIDMSSSLSKKRTDGLPLVYCGSDWRVEPNEVYNIRGYTGLNICFFYNHKVTEWRRILPDKVKDLLAGNVPFGDRLKARSFADFPLYRTFEQNPPYVIDLSVAQVNLLSNLTEWILTNKIVVEDIRTHIKLLPPPNVP